MLVPMLVFLLVLIGPVVWVYLDAETHSSHPSVLWAAVVFLAPLLGLILYVLLGRDLCGASPAGTGRTDDVR